MKQAKSMKQAMRIIFTVFCVLLWIGLDALVNPVLAETPFVNDAQLDAPSSVIKKDKKWQEQKVRLPAWPKDADLVEIKLDGPEDEFRHFIDSRSLRTGGDGVVRYTLVTESAYGARNIGYEGVRCTPRGRYKIYAYGSGSNFIPTNSGEQWRPIDEHSRDRLRYELWRHYLCMPRLFKTRQRKDQLRMLKSGRIPQVENAGFINE